MFDIKETNLLETLSLQRREQVINTAILAAKQLIETRKSILGLCGLIEEKIESALILETMSDSAVKLLLESIIEIKSPLEEDRNHFPAGLVARRCEDMEQALHDLNGIYCNKGLYDEEGKLDKESQNYKNLRSYQQNLLEIFEDEFRLQLGLHEDSIEQKSVFHELYQLGRNLVIPIVEFSEAE